MQTQKDWRSVLALLPLFAGCASAPPLENYPRAQIDRPYTLPKGLASWETWVYARKLDYDNFFEDDSYYIPYPLIWKSSLSDNWTLIWFPVPFGIQHQVYRDDRHMLGITAVVNFTAGSEGFAFHPALFLDYRFKLFDSIGMEFNTFGEPHFGHDYGRPKDISFGAGPIFQIMETVAIAPKLRYRIKTDTYTLSNVDYDFAAGQWNVTNETRTETIRSFPLEFWAGWSMSRQWDLTGQLHIWPERWRVSPDGREIKATYYDAILKLIHTW